MQDVLGGGLRWSTQPSSDSSARARSQGVQQGSMHSALPVCRAAEQQWPTKHTRHNGLLLQQRQVAAQADDARQLVLSGEQGQLRGPTRLPRVRVSSSSSRLWARAPSQSVQPEWAACTCPCSSSKQQAAAGAAKPTLLSQPARTFDRRLMRAMAPPWLKPPTTMESLGMPPATSFSISSSMYLGSEERADKSVGKLDERDAHSELGGFVDLIARRVPVERQVGHHRRPSASPSPDMRNPPTSGSHAWPPHPATRCQYGPGQQCRTCKTCSQGNMLMAAGKAEARRRAACQVAGGKHAAYAAMRSCREELGGSPARHAHAAIDGDGALEEGKGSEERTTSGAAIDSTN